MGFTITGLDGNSVDLRSLSDADRDRYPREAPFSTRWLARELGTSASTVNRIRRKRGRQERVVYFIACGDLVKIGKTFDIEARIRDLQCGSPVLLTLLKTTPGYSELESALHNHFADRRRHGEWFDVTLAEVDAFLATLPNSRPRQLASGPHSGDSALTTQPIQPPLLGPDGLIQDHQWHTPDGPHPIKPDHYGAAQLVLAASHVIEGGATGGISEAMYQIMSTRPGLPLLNGLIFMNVVFAQAVYGDLRTERLDKLALLYAMRDGISGGEDA